MYKLWIVLAALAGASAVALGAYVSHGLGFIASPEARELARASLQTAVNYQLLHALALFAVGLWARGGGGKWLTLAGALFTIGIALFCGLIYLRYLVGYDGLRRLIPWGGSSFILAWLVLAIAALKDRSNRLS